MSDVQLKTCPKCEEERPLTPEHWYFDSGKPTSPCRECKKASARAAKQKAPQPAPEPRSEAIEFPDLSEAAQKQLAAHEALALRRIRDIANKPNHPKHWDAIKYIAERAKKGQAPGGPATIIRKTIINITPLPAVPADPEGAE